MGRTMKTDYSYPGETASIKQLDQQVKEIEESGGGGGGTTDYDKLTNKPKINDVELVGNKTDKDLNIKGGNPEAISDDEIDAICQLN